jgi:YrbI family 3-deoxy-D-manno-octulosonate 8-phosphate phosphatase
VIRGSEIDDALRARVRRLRLVAFDFDGVFTDNTVIVSEDGSESVRCWRGDGLGLRKLEALGLGLVIVSTEPNPVVAMRAKKLRIRCLHGLEDKLAAVQALADEAGCGLDAVAYVGNDVNDRSCLEAVGLPVVVADAHADVASLAAYRTRAPGGRGAVREVCDLFEGILRERP